MAFMNFITSAIGVVHYARYRSNPIHLNRPRSDSDPIIVRSLVSSISLEWPSSGVFKAGRPSTWWTAVTYFGCRQPSASLLCQLIFPQHRRSKFGRQAFSVVGPMTWNSLHDNLHDSMLSDEKFWAALKTLFSKCQNTDVAQYCAL